jgi:hypothetical protein
VARNWKLVERKLAAYLGGERVPVSGRTRGWAPDISHGWLALEVKSWKNFPARVIDALDQAEKSAIWAKRRGEAEKLPLAILHKDRTDYGNSLCVMRLSDFREWFGGQVGLPDLVHSSPPAPEPDSTSAKA